jgi:hypothetical protein
MFKDQPEAFKKGFKVGSLYAEHAMVGTIDSMERRDFWKGVFARAQYELNKLKVSDYD